jgi:membrane protein
MDNFAHLLQNDWASSTVAREPGLQHRPEMLAYFDVALGWGELLKRTARETQADNGLGLAAQLAYYFFLALFPALLFLIALAGLLPAEDLIGQVMGRLQGVAPPDVVEIIREQLVQITRSGSAGILTFGAIAALWSSSAAMVALIEALNRAYDVEEARPWWKQRLTAILLTMGVAAFILVSIVLVVSGPQLAEFLAGQVGLGTAFEWTWKILQWPLVFALVATAIGLIYYFAPDVEQDFVWLTPGSLLATFLWLVGSLAFRFYVVNFGSYNETYGSIGGVMVLMLWLYLSGLAIVIGAEMNAEIEHAAPHGKEPGEKVPGQRRTIGARAAREFRARRPGQPALDRRPAAAVPAARPGTVAAMARSGVLIGGAIAALFGRRIRE